MDDPTLRLAAERAVRTALDEDAAAGDVTSRCTVPAPARAHGVLVARAPLVVCGLDVARLAFAALDADCRWHAHVGDGQRVEAGAVLAEVEGRARALLAAERTALNLVQRLSGIATEARRWAERAERLGVRVVDTRKTTPGLRALERYAVRTGGLVNHRSGLEGGVLVKENHILAAGGVWRAVERARRAAPHALRIEVECRCAAEVEEARQAGADAVLVDNLRGDDLARAVAAAGSMLVEVSGGIGLDELESVAIDGVQVVSVGRLTHSAPAADVALDLTWVETPVGAWRVRRLARCASTNDEARRWADEEAPKTREWRAVVADEQTAGRGRAGHRWWSPRGRNLYLSAILRPRLRARQATALPLAVGVAVARALSEFGIGRERLELKWPNDVLIDGRKVAGILVESASVGEDLTWAIAGIGIDVNVPAGEFPAELREVATSLRAAREGRLVDREAVLEAVLAAVADEVEALEARGGLLDVDGTMAWMRPGRPLVVRTAEASWTGNFECVDEEGALWLRVEKERGSETVRVTSAEVLLPEWTSARPRLEFRGLSSRGRAEEPGRKEPAGFFPQSYPSVRRGEKPKGDDAPGFVVPPAAERSAKLQPREED